MARCYQCMKEYPDGYDICPHCGYDQTSEAENLYYLPAGTVLGQGRYLVGKAVNAGGFGIVYRVWDQTFSKVVAIKEYFPSAIATRIPGTTEVRVHSNKNMREYEVGKSRFLSEARRVAKFQTNPNVVDVYDFFEENETAYMVMEFMDGMTYKQFIRSQGGKVKPDLACRVTLAVLDALSEVHRERIVHRDINPNNIFICQDGKVKLYDFGAARLETTDMTTILTPCYAPPEQYITNGKQGSYTDLYSVGATMYFALTGVKPQESTDRVQKDQLTPPHEIDAEIPVDMSNAVMRAMAVKEEIRFQNAEQFKKALTEGKVLDVKREIARRRRVRLIQIASMFLVLLAAGGAAAMRIKSQREASSLKPADIQVWVAADENDTADGISAEERFQNMTKSFQEDYRIRCDVTVIPADEYKQKLNEAAAGHALPDVFDSTCLDAKYLDQLEPLDETLRLMEDVSAYYYLDEYEKLFPDKKQLPLCFQLPLIFERTDPNTAREETTAELSSLEALTDSEGRYSYAIRPEDLAIYQEAFGEDCIKKYREQFPDAEGLGEAWQDFLKGKVQYYLSDTSDYQLLYEQIPGQFQVAYPEQGAVRGRLDHLWSVNGESGRDEKKAAQWLIYYMLSDTAQNELSVKSLEGVPLNRTIFTQVFLEAYRGNLPELDGRIQTLSVGDGESIQENYKLWDTWGK